jgi:hypothetical protein
MLSSRSFYCENPDAFETETYLEMTQNNVYDIFRFGFSQPENAERIFRVQGIEQLCGLFEVWQLF